MTHTPGPWIARVDLFRPPKLFVHAPDSYAVCRVMTAHYHAEVARANAHVIAAAPEMFSALEFILEHSGDPVMENVARAAIAKAEGHS